MKHDYSQYKQITVKASVVPVRAKQVIQITIVCVCALCESEVALVGEGRVHQPWGVPLVLICVRKLCVNHLQHTHT